MWTSSVLHYITQKYEGQHTNSRLDRPSVRPSVRQTGKM